MTVPTPAAPADPNTAIPLRDWFAGQALVGMIPMPRSPGVLVLSMDGMAGAAYQYADAMMRARAKT